MELSIIIPSYCAQRNLNACLKSIEKQIVTSVEVIVVDCSPHDEVKHICANYQFVKYVHVRQRFNPGRGRNIGAHEAEGRYLAFIDSDVELDERAIVNILDIIKTNKFTVFGCSLELNKRFANSFSANVEHYYFNHEAQSSRKVQKRSNLSSAFMVIEKTIFDRNNGFKDLARMQDTEFTERLVKTGVTLYFIPQVIGYQIQDSNITKVLKKIKITGNNLFYVRGYSDKTNYFYKLFLFMLTPFFMLFKITRINFRNLRYTFSLKVLFIYSPFMYVCGIYWLLGFYKAQLLNRGIESGR
jgi:glycosyltransferase involved in cell wall biosynthesis